MSMINNINPYTVFSVNTIPKQNKNPNKREDERKKKQKESAFSKQMKRFSKDENPSPLGRTDIKI